MVPDLEEIDVRVKGLAWLVVSNDERRLSVGEFMSTS